MINQVQTTLHVQWPGGGLAASPDKAPILVGRAPEAHVHIAHRSVSREHLRLVSEDGRWVAVDQSSRGTFGVDGSRVERISLGPEEMTLHLGAPDGPAIRLVTATVAPEGGGSMPVVPPIQAGAAWTVATSDPTLRLEVDGQKYLFAPPGRVVVGRDSGCDIVCDNDLVSRQHVAFTSPGTRWWIEDLGSSRGTFVDGRRVRKARPAQGAFVAVLGDDDAGERLQVVTAGTHKKPRNKAPMVAGVAAAAIAALVAVAAVLLMPDDDGAEVANTREQLDFAARATVGIELLDANGQTMGTGSGTIVSPDGLILTNAHVADPVELSSGDVSEDPAGFGIYVVSDATEPVEPRYVAEVAAVHPTFDAALLRIVSDVDGQAVEQTDSEVLPIGDSEQLASGTHVHQLGFPGIAGTDELSIADVTIQSFATLPPCSDVPPDVLILSCSGGEPLRDGLMNYSGAALGHGSSGGPFVHQGALVAINVGARELEGDVQTFAQPIHTIADWLADNGVES